MKVTTCEKNEKETNKKETKRKSQFLPELSVKKKILYLLLPLVGNTKIL